MYRKKLETKIIFTVLTLFFIAFLFAPLLILSINSFKGENGIGFSNYYLVTHNKEFLIAIGNSIKVSLITALITTISAFITIWSGLECSENNKRV